MLCLTVATMPPHLMGVVEDPNLGTEILVPHLRGEAKGNFVMGWLRLVGCLKIQVSLQNTGLFCRALLQKRPIFLSILLIVATPYEYV